MVILQIASFVGGDVEHPALLLPLVCTCVRPDQTNNPTQPTNHSIQFSHPQKNKKEKLFCRQKKSVIKNLSGNYKQKEKKAKVAYFLKCENKRVVAVVVVVC